jgi:hypothetical protein
MLDETIQQANHAFISQKIHRIYHVLHTQHKINMIIMPEIANAVIFPYLGKSLKHSELITLLIYNIPWMRSTANKIERLAQGLKRGVKGTNTIRFIRRTDVPPGRKTTYDPFVVDIKTHKEDTEPTRFTAGGDYLE